MTLSLQWLVMTDSRQGESDAPSPLVPLFLWVLFTVFCRWALKCVVTQIQLHHADVLVLTFVEKEKKTTDCGICIFINQSLAQALEIPTPPVSYPNVWPGI